jgi:hypothetical protein
MIRLPILLVCLFSVSICYSQGEFKEYKGKHHELLTNLAFSKQSKIHYSGKRDYVLFGQTYPFENFKINSRIRVQVKEVYWGDGNKWSKRNTKFKLYCRQDTNCVFLDSILRRIHGNLRVAREWNIKYNQPIDSFRVHGGIDDWGGGIFVCDGVSIPYIMTPHEHTGAFYILWIDQRIYYLELTGRTKGLGSMSSFKRNSIALRTKTDTYNFVSETSISRITELIDGLEKKYLLE